MKYVKTPITLRDSSSGEIIVSADLTAPRVKALIKAYALAGIVAVA
jgi:hypothetical protein